MSATTEVPHCGLCDPVTRHVENGDGRLARCPRCWPPHADKPNAPRPDALLPQHARCPACRAVIFRTEQGTPCGMHRTVVGFHREYDAARAGAVPLAPNPVTDAGAGSAREQLAARPRPEPPVPPDPPPGEDGAPEGDDDFPY